MASLGALVEHPTVRVLGRLGREVARLGHDRVAGGGPRRIEDVTAAHVGGWLGTPVRSIERLDATSGTTDRARFALEGGRDDVPASVFVKIPSASPGIRLFGYLAGLGENEVRFYREVRPTLDVQAPQLLGSAFDTSLKRYALVLEDLAARGATFTDARTSLTPAQSLRILEDLARLHASHWDDASLDGDLAWVRPNRDDPLLPAVQWALHGMARRLDQRLPELVPPEGRAILTSWTSIVTDLDRGPHGLLHGDPHPGNCWFVDSSGGLFDWQLLRRGNPLRDVTYHLATALDADTRRAVERDLLDGYREALAAHGGPTLSADEVWQDHRRMAAAPYVAAAFTVGMGGLQRDDIARVGLERAAAAIADLGTASALALDVDANRGVGTAKIPMWRSRRTPR